MLERFNETYLEGMQYAAGFSFCPPTCIELIKQDNIHMLTYSDAAHTYLSGAHFQTNLSDANSHGISGLNVLLFLLVCTSCLQCVLLAMRYTSCLHTLILRACAP